MIHVFPVIDFCLTKQLITDPGTNFQCLELTWASKANLEQRSGRAGRLMDGRAYRLISESFYKVSTDLIVSNDVCNNQTK